MDKTLSILTFSLAMLCSFGLNAQSVTFSGPQDCSETANADTWTVPNWLTSITVDVYGGGGGGAGSGGGANGGLFYMRAGGGGGAGGHASITINVTPGSTFSYSAAAGGCGGDPGPDTGNGNDGGNGGISTFSGTDADGNSVYLTANGGVGGTGGEGSNGNAGLGGAGGSATGGTTNTTGDAGEDGNEDNHGSGGTISGPNGGDGGTDVGASGASFGGGAAGGGDSRGGNGGPGGIVISGPLDVADHKNELGLSLSPNPVIDEAWLDFTVKETDRFSIVVLDVAGKLVSTVHSGILNEGKQHFDLTSQLPAHAGIYLVQVRYSNGNSTSRLTVN